VLLQAGHCISLLWTLSPWVPLHNWHSKGTRSHGGAQFSQRTWPQSQGTQDARFVPLSGNHVVQWASSFTF
jgi:hypothetical protein